MKILLVERTSRRSGPGASFERHYERRPFKRCVYLLNRGACKRMDIAKPETWSGPESKFPGSPVNQAVVNIYQFALL